ncbi:Transposase [Balamuthia mandrillaris]
MKEEDLFAFIATAETLLYSVTARSWRAHFGVSFETALVAWTQLKTCTFERPLQAKYLLWTFYFLKVYSTEEVACSFCKCTPKTFRYWVWAIIRALSTKLAEMFQHFNPSSTITTIVGIVDSTECPIQRPIGSKRQRIYYSGKKKRHTLKYELVLDLKTELFTWVNGPFPGRVHDLTIARNGLVKAAQQHKLLGDKAYRLVVIELKWNVL